MVLVKEFRIVMPMTVAEYQIGQLYSTARMSAEESHGDAGVEVLTNEPFEDENGKGQYTHKIYHLGTRVPGWVRALAPGSALKLDEEAWNAYPFCKTVLTNPFLGDRFRFEIVSLHKDDRGDTDNVHGVDEKTLKKMNVVHIDIATPHKDIPEEEDPCKQVYEKAGRGPFEEGWQEQQDVLMCCYKLVTVEFRMWGVQGRVEKLMMGYEDDIFLKFHKQIIAWLDDWVAMDLKKVRRYEKKMNKLINSKMAELVGADNLAVDVNANAEETTEESTQMTEDADEKKKKKKKKKKEKKAEEAEETEVEETEGYYAEDGGEKKKKKKKKKKKAEEEEEEEEGEE